MDKWQYVGMVGEPGNREKVYTQDHFMQIGSARDPRAFPTIAVDSHDYRYTHGGRLYCEACDLVWENRRVKHG